MKLLQSATKWFETFRPKWTFWRFPDFKRGKDSVSSPIPSMQCCATVRATFRKQETSQLSMEGTGEGCGFLCFWSYPIWVQCLNNFVAYCSLQKQPVSPRSSLLKTFWRRGMRRDGCFPGYHVGSVITLNKIPKTWRASVLPFISLLKAAKVTSIATHPPNLRVNRSWSCSFLLFPTCFRLAKGWSHLRVISHTLLLWIIKRLFRTSLDYYTHFYMCAG